MSGTTILTVPLYSVMFGNRALEFIDEELFLPSEVIESIKRVGRRFCQPLLQVKPEDFEQRFRDLFPAFMLHVASALLSFFQTCF